MTLGICPNTQYIYMYMTLNIHFVHVQYVYACRHLCAAAVFRIPISQLMQPHVLYLGSEYTTAGGTCGEYLVSVLYIYNTCICMCTPNNTHSVYMYIHVHVHTFIGTKRHGGDVKVPQHILSQGSQRVCCLYLSCIHHIYTGIFSYRLIITKFCHSQN